MRNAVWAPLRLDLLEDHRVRGEALALYALVLLPAARRAEGWTFETSRERLGLELRCLGFKATRDSVRRSLDSLRRAGLIITVRLTNGSRMTQVSLCDVNTYMSERPNTDPTLTHARARGAMKTEEIKKKKEEENAVPASASKTRQPPPAYAVLAQKLLRSIKDRCELGAGSVTGYTQGRVSRMLREAQDLTEAEKRLGALADELVALWASGKLPDVVACFIRQAPARLARPGGGNGHHKPLREVSFNGADRPMADYLKELREREDRIRKEREEDRLEALRRNA